MTSQVLRALEERGLVDRQFFGLLGEEVGELTALLRRLATPPG